jgi:hypothetical protein
MENNIGMSFKDTECENVDFIHVWQISVQRQIPLSMAVHLLIP